METFRCIALIPSYRGEVEGLRRVCAAYLGANVTPYIVPTSAEAERRVLAAGLPFLSIEANPGYGKSIDIASKLVEWDWMIVSNDDLSLVSSELESALGKHCSDCHTKALVFLDPDRYKQYPTPARVFFEVSLIRALYKKILSLWHSAEDMEFDRATMFGGFSIAVIGRELWDDLGGMDSRLIYTYEDADFSKRALRTGADIHAVRLPSLEHNTSYTSRSMSGRVLPVAAWSAAEYLGIWHTSRLSAKVIVLMALVFRLVLPAPSVGGIKTHFRSIFDASKSLMSSSPPHLPDY